MNGIFRFLVIASKKRRLNQHVALIFGSKLLSQISTSDIECFKKKRIENGAAHGAVNRELSIALVDIKHF
jgi:hypothetical protein